MAHPSRSWNAMETTDLIGSEYTLSVTGEVQTLGTNEHAKLAVAHPQGIVAQELILTLTIEKDSGTAGHVVQWTPVEYQHKISSQQYHSVRIRGDVDDQMVKVERALS